MPQQTEIVVLPGGTCAERADKGIGPRTANVAACIRSGWQNHAEHAARGVAPARFGIPVRRKKAGCAPLSPARRACSRLLPGGLVPVDGILHRVTPAPVRSVTREGDRLLVPETGPAGARVAAFLKARARDRLVPDGRPLCTGSGPQGGCGVLARHAFALGVMHGARTADVLLAAGDGPAHRAGLRCRA